MQKWAAGGLGVVALALRVHLVLQYNRGITRPVVSTRPRAKASAHAGAKAVAGKQKTSDELSHYDPIVKLDLLKGFADRPLPEMKRNPFEFVGGPRQMTQVKGPGPAPGPEAPPPAPPPPPATMKAMGYTEGKAGANEAMVVLCATNCENSSPDDQILVVHAGDSVGTRYKIIKITPTVISVEDATLHQNVDMPFPP